MERLALYAPNGVLIAYLKGSGEIDEDIQEDLPPVDPNKPFPEDKLVQVLDTTAEQLTGLFETPFAGANIQRSNLDDRMTQIQPRQVPTPPAPAASSLGLVGLSDIVHLQDAAGKEAVGKAPPPPVYQPGPHWGVWANGWGDFVNINDTTLAKGYRFTTGGMSAGIDYRITDHLAVGLFCGYSHTRTDFRPGSADVGTGRGGLYATYFDTTGWWVNAGVWGGYNSYSTSRQALFGPAKWEHRWLRNLYLWRSRVQLPLRGPWSGVRS